MNSLPSFSEVDLRPEPSDGEYEAWLRAKVAVALRDTRPALAHGDAMAVLRARLDAKVEPLNMAAKSSS